MTLPRTAAFAIIVFFAVSCAGDEPTNNDTNGADNSVAVNNAQCGISPAPLCSEGCQEAPPCGCGQCGVGERLERPEGLFMCTEEFCFKPVDCIDAEDCDGNDCTDNVCVGDADVGPSDADAG